MSGPGGHPAPVTIRPGRADDLPAILRLINEAFLVEKSFVDGDRTDLADLAARLARGQFLCALAGEAIVACVYLELRGERGYFGMLAVDPARQGTGLGRRLVAEAEATCRARGCTVMDIQVVNLRTELPPYYRALGYGESGTIPFGEGEVGKAKRPCHFVRMSKRL